MGGHCPSCHIRPGLLDVSSKKVERRHWTVPVVDVTRLACAGSASGLPYYRLCQWNLQSRLPMAPVNCVGAMGRAGMRSFAACCQTIGRTWLGYCTYYSATTPFLV